MDSQCGCPFLVIGCSRTDFRQVVSIGTHVQRGSGFFFDEVCLRVWSSNLVGSCTGHAFSHLRIRMLAMGGGSDDAICVFPVAVARGWLKALADVDPLVLWPSAINFLSVKVTEQSYDT